MTGARPPSGPPVGDADDAGPVRLRPVCACGALAGGAGADARARGPRAASRAALADPAFADPALQLGAAATVLHAITQPGTVLAVWRRAPDPVREAWLQALARTGLPDTWAEGSPAEVSAAVGERLLRAQGHHGGPLAAFVTEVCELACRYVLIAGGERLRLRLAVQRDAAAGPWHDAGPLPRLVCTAAGPGTQWRWPHRAGLAAVRERAPGQAEASGVHGLQPGDVACLRDTGRPGAGGTGGLAYRRPASEGFDRGRVVLVLDRSDGPDAPLP
ncbi:DUF1826 domain-containing protein [Piscinibacter sakaiensis]|uniref:DUF1826 domain-containing protein n=1 Tax=Piscinibacter sakaiensis TaxID=1547922 RepID=A0A0K8P5S3_PISS1|nr:DUF1826 domain-containing protein [Piscinibacter sakaiensis]GAP38068.1 hypothetical protein ISF6_4262 [Piscinibacter sakaiensis]